jgi:outer membrane protein assembly factor BamB
MARTTRSWKPILRTVAVLAGVAVLPAVPASSAGSRPKATAEVDWSTYGYDVMRTGYNPNETTLGVDNVGTLDRIWSFDLGAVTIMQPGFAANVLLNGNPTDIVYVGSEHGAFFALNADTGAVVWQRNLGFQDTDCWDMPDSIFGVSGAPSIDRANNRLFVVGGDGNLYSLDLSTGATTSGWPVTVIPDPAIEHTYGGVTVRNGKVYVEVASYCDFGAYHGKVEAVDIPTAQRVAVWFPAGRDVVGGGVWGPGGVSVDPITGHVFAATGNALTDPEYFKFAEHVVELTGSLRPLGADYPGLIGGDVDFGATPLLYHPPGCPLLVAAKNKTGILLVYKRGELSSGALQRIQIADVDDWQFNGIPAYSPVTNMVYVSNSSTSNEGTFVNGMVALRVAPDTCSLTLAWQYEAGWPWASVSPPTVANGVVYYGDGPNDHVYAFDAATGEKLWDSETLIKAAIYAAPIVVNGRLYVGSWDKKLYAFAPTG